MQAFEGVVIARSRGPQASFTVRKISFGHGVERIFPLHSKVIDKVELLRSSKVRRAKLYYLRGLKGKAARLKDVDREHVVAEVAAQLIRPRSSDFWRNCCGESRSALAVDFELQRFFQVFFRQLANQELQDLAITLADLMEFDSQAVLIAVADLAL